MGHSSQGTLINIPRHSTGVKFTGIIYFPPVATCRVRFVTPVYIFGELRSEKALEDALFGRDAQQEQGFKARRPNPAIHQGAQFYDLEDKPESAQDILRMALKNRPVVPETHHEFYDEGGESGTIGWFPGRRDGETRELKEGMRKAMEKDLEVKELRRELDEQKSRAQEEANDLRNHIAAMQREEVRVREEMHRVENRCQELEEQKGRTQGEMDDLRKRIAEIQSEFEEDRCRAPGEPSDAYDCSPCSLLSHSRAFHGSVSSPS